MSAEVFILQAHQEALLASVANEVFDHPPHPALVSEFLSDPRHHIAVAVLGGVVIGFASAVHYVHPDKPAELWVNEVGVAPESRRKGIARELLSVLFELGRQLGCQEAWVLTERDNGPACSLYQALGGVESAPDPVLFSFQISESPPTRGETSGVTLGDLLDQYRLARRESRLEDGLLYAAAAVARARDEGAVAELVIGLKALAQIERDRGMGNASIPFYEEAIELARAADDLASVAHTLRHLGDVHLGENRVADAESPLVEALEIRRRLGVGSPLELANTVRPVAELRDLQGRESEAQALWAEASSLYAAAGVQAGVDACNAHLRHEP